MSFYQLGCCLFDSLFSQVQQVWSVRVALADVRDASAGEAVIVCTTSTQRVQGVVTVRWRLVTGKYFGGNTVVSKRLHVMLFSSEPWKLQVQFQNKTK